MKIRRVRLENVRSFLSSTELLMDGDITILIGPNGGGKTNLLDTIALTIRRHLLKSWYVVPSPTVEIEDRFEFRENDEITNVQLEKHSRGIGRDQSIEIEVEVTQRDIENMAAIKASVPKLGAKAWTQYVNYALREAADWDLSDLKLGDRFTYRVVNNGMQATQGVAATFRSYLALYDADAWVRDQQGLSELSTPVLSLPTTRAGNFSSSVALASYNPRDLKRSVDAAHSRSGPSIMNLAIGRLALKYRLLLDKHLGADLEPTFYNDPSLKALSLILEDLGYKWRIETINAQTNSYNIRIEKQGHSFLVHNASSGEKELLTYLFGLFALNVRDALVVIDEPELHLHPKWQSLLLSLFDRLAKQTGNQFLMATHSPMFVSPASIQYVSRVFSRDQESDVVRMDDANLPDKIKLFSIINSQNNERVFFSDAVVLVEGPSDRLVFEKIFAHLKVSSSARLLEVVDVGGKAQFDAYSKVLEAVKVPFAIIADRDYLLEIGSPAVKALFKPDRRNVAGAIHDPASLDGQGITYAIENAIADESVDSLKKVYSYVQERRRKLRGELSSDENIALRAEIESKRSSEVYILSKGSLESYLPRGFRSKSLQNIISFLSRADWWNLISIVSRTELETIAKKIRTSERLMLR